MSPGDQRVAVVVGALLVHLVVLGTIYSFGVFLEPVADDLGIRTGTASIVLSINLATMLVTGRFVATLTDRMASGAVPVAGAVLVIAGLASLTVTRSTLVLFAGFGLTFGAGAGLLIVPSVAAVVRTASASTGLATGIAVSGAGIGSVVIAPLAAWLIRVRSWRFAAGSLTLALAPVLLTAILLVARAAPTAAPAAPSVRVRVRGDGALRTLYWSTVVLSFGLMVPFVHLAPFAERHGATSSEAALLVSALAAANTAGRLSFGALADRVGRRRTLLTVITVMGIALMLWPLAQHRPTLVAFSLLFGLSAGGYFALLPAITGDYFDRSSLAEVNGILYFGSAAGTFAGPALVGVLSGSTRSFAIGAVLAGMTVLAGAAIAQRLPRHVSAPA